MLLFILLDSCDLEPIDESWDCCSVALWPWSGTWKCHPINIISIRAFDTNKYIKFLNLGAWVSIQLAQHKHPALFKMP